MREFVGGKNLSVIKMHSTTIKKITKMYVSPANGARS